MSPSPLHAAILSVGDEVVTGVIVDTNAAWLAAEATRLGIRPRLCGAVGDDRGVIADGLRAAMHEAEVVLVTGGLGPTEDDLTREGLADALGVPLAHHPEAEAQIRAFYERLGRAMPATTMKQARVPSGCDVIPNAWGTAPGVAFRGPPGAPAGPPGEPAGARGASAGTRGNASGDAPRRVYLLPGVPIEMKNMFAATVLPEMTALAGTRRTVSRVIRTIGMSEAALGEAIADLMNPARNPHVGINVSETIVTVRINATGDAAAAEGLAETDARDIRRRLGPVVFGEGDATLAAAVGDLLRAQRRTVATAESCTGGLVAKMLTDVPGASDYFLCGYVTYANQAKAALLGVAEGWIERDGAVSESVARAMAEGGRRVSGADFGVSVTGVAGPGGGSADKPVGLVWFGLAGVDGTTAHRITFGEHLTREQIRDRASKAALNLLRLRLLNPPGTNTI
ncbi:MAG: Nicotinamide-nucleotide amidohydrolase PncC [Phycisphaerae bacterium]|nr:Nicotinamide-nucleotide amidohydrolase PncC [Phycisphaerae bacterium]